MQHMHYPDHLCCPCAEQIEAKVANPLGFYNAPKNVLFYHGGDSEWSREEPVNFLPCHAVLILANEL